MQESELNGSQRAAQQVKRCVDCGAVNNNGMPRCPQCWGRARDAERLKAKGNANFSCSPGTSGSAVDSKPSDSVGGLIAGFEGEAALLEKCWRKVHDFEPVPTGEQATSLAASLFISLEKNQRFERIRRS